MRNRMRINSWAMVLMILLFALAGCDTGQEGGINHNPVNPNTEFKFTRGGAPLGVWVRLSEIELELTDYLTVTIESRFSEGVRVTPPYLSESVYSPLLLIEQPKEETVWSETDAIMINRWIYTFEPMNSGQFTLKPFSIYFRLEKEQSDRMEQWPVYELQTDPISYNVKPITADPTADIRDIKGLLYPSYNFFAPVVAILGIAGLLTGYLVWLRYFKSRRLENATSQTNIDYYQESLMRLQALEQKDLIGKAEFDAFHTELSAILRDYLEYTFGLRAKEQTTQEFIEELVTTRQFTVEQRHDLDRFLRLADLVKFATFQPGSQISEAALNGVRAFIHSTGKPDEV